MTTRAEEGLPAKAVVLAAFNNVRKLTPTVFGDWMRILAQVPPAVIWLVCQEATARRNLQAAAQQHGIDSGRLVFASGAPQEQHLARHHLADFFLDTFPCNAHTTASDALWMGLPVLTLQGDGFAARVAASLLTAVGLEELIAHSPADYVQLAVQLAQSPDRIAQYRAHLNQYRDESPLFDTKRYARNLEQAFGFMLDRSRKGKAAHPFEVRDMSLGGGIRLSGSPTFRSVAGPAR
jgi:predicted O-linked N-acetylglucosamine transferase (SPINDLY family)